MSSIAIVYTEPSFQNQAERLAEQLGLDCVDAMLKNNYSAVLSVTSQGLELSFTAVDAPGPLFVDFLKGRERHRQLYGGGRRQLLARALCLHKQKNPTICDVSAGLGRDAFVLAALGAQVTMIERSPIIGALLQDGWQRAQCVDWIRDLTWRYLQLDSFIYLQNLSFNQRPQMIYFDPMFPERKKSALVKKEMRIIREFAGEDTDAPALLSLALTVARERVVVKRPRLASSIPGPVPHFTLMGQSCRFDIYTKAIS